MEDIMLTWIIFLGAAFLVYVAGLFKYAFNAKEKGPDIPSLNEFRARMPQHRTPFPPIHRPLP
jgi:hypothetical protein